MEKDPSMGTREEAEKRLVAEWQNWTKYMGVTIATRKQHRQNDAYVREAETRLKNAAAVLAWHLDFDGVKP